MDIYTTLSRIGIIIGIVTPPIFIVLMLYQIKLQRDALKDKKTTEKKIKSNFIMRFFSFLENKYINFTVILFLSFSIVHSVFLDDSPITKVNVFSIIFSVCELFALLALMALNKILGIMDKHLDIMDRHIDMTNFLAKKVRYIKPNDEPR